MPRIYRPSQASRDRAQYVPAQMQQALTDQMQHSLPAHLKKYANGNGGYVPRYAEKAITDHMQKHAPSYMKPYVGAYVQQQVIYPTGRSAGAGPVQPRPVVGRAPTPNQLRLDHSNVSSTQYEARFNNNLFASDAQQATPPTYSAPVTGPGQTPARPSSDYDFIFNAPPPPSSSNASNSMLVRVAVVGVGLVLLLSLFAVGKSLLSPKSGFVYLTNVAQDQQQLLHLADIADQQQEGDQKVAISTANLNFLRTAELGLKTQQGQLLDYLKSNHHSVKDKALNLKVDGALDEQLSAAAAAATFDQTFHEAMESKLNVYIADLKQAYTKAPGEKGKALLDDEYDAAQLLLTQLNTPAQ